MLKNKRKLDNNINYLENLINFLYSLNARQMTYRLNFYLRGKSGLCKDTVPGNAWRGRPQG